MGIAFIESCPVAVFAALLAQDIMTPNGNLVPVLHNEKLFAPIPVAAAAVLTRSLLGTVVVGVISMMVVTEFF